MVWNRHLSYVPMFWIYFAKLLQLCPTLCDPIDGSPPGSPIPGILQARTLEVGCHFLLQCIRVKSESEVAQSCPTSQSHGLQPTRLLHTWDFPGKSIGVGCNFLLHNMSLEIIKQQINTKTQKSDKSYSRYLRELNYKIRKFDSTDIYNVLSNSCRIDFFLMYAWNN